MLFETKQAFFPTSTASINAAALLAAQYSNDFHKQSVMDCLSWKLTAMMNPPLRAVV